MYSIVHYSTAHYICTVQYITVQHSAYIQYSTVQHSTYVQYSTLYYSTYIQYSTLQYSTVHYSTLGEVVGSSVELNCILGNFPGWGAGSAPGSVQYSTVQHTVQYSTVQYSTVLYCTLYSTVIMTYTCFDLPPKLILALITVNNTGII